MMDLNLKVLNENELPNIIIRPYSYSFEELIDIINEQDDELTLLEFNRFCDEFEQGLDRYASILVLNDYINNHGVDQAVEELFGTEGLIEGVKNAVVSFVKWLWKQLTNLARLIKQIFSSRKAPKGNSPKDRSMRIVYGSKEERNKVIQELKKEEGTKKDNPSTPKEGTKKDNPPTPKEEANPKAEPKTETKPRHTNFHGLIIIKCDPPATSAALKGIAGMIAVLVMKGINGLADFKTVLPDAPRNKDNAAKMFNIWFDKYKKALDSSEKYVSRMDAITWIDTTSGYASAARVHAVAIANEMEKLPKLPNIISQNEAQNYVKKACDLLKINLGSNEGDQLNAIKGYVAGIRSVAAIGLKCDRMLLPKVMHIVSQLAHNSFKDADNGRGGMNLRGAHADGAVDVRVPIPNGLMQRIREAWGASEGFKIKRIIITNSRSTSANNSDSGIQGATHNSNLFVSYPGIRRDGVNAEIILNYGYFKSQLRVKENIESYKKQLNNSNILPDHFNIELSTDRVELFLRTVVHECRHVFQNATGNKRHDRDVKPNSHLGYLDLAHEKDARQAAKDFKFEKSDVDWAEKLFDMCLKQEYKNLEKHN